jgi:hypothetical protein
VQPETSDTTRTTVFGVNPSEGKRRGLAQHPHHGDLSEEMNASIFDANTIRRARGTTSISLTMTTSTDGSGRTVPLRSTRLARACRSSPRGRPTR